MIAWTRLKLRYTYTACHVLISRLFYLPVGGNEFYGKCKPFNLDWY
jgi:hypothetical protein